MKKGPFSNSSPKTFNLNFAPMGCSQEREKLTLFVSGEYHIGAKFGLKVFGKRSGEEPFFRKVFPSKYPYCFCMSTAPKPSAFHVPMYIT